MGRLDGKRILMTGAGGLLARGYVQSICSRRGELGASNAYRRET